VVILFSNKVDFSNYDYIMFVDASGDDGMKFDKGSSLCFTVACFISSTSDIQTNLKTLNNIKRISDRNESNEIKFSALRRHKRYPDALRELDELKGSFSIYNVFKKSVSDEECLGDPKLKLITSIPHGFSISTLFRNDMFNDKRILICIDRMKDVGMEYLDTFLERTVPDTEDIYCSYDVIFRDSKAHNFELIQIADIAAGISRRFFEDTVTDNEFVSFIR